jgi:Hint domain
MADTLTLAATQNGTTITLDVNVSGDTDPDSFDISLQYDSASATFNSFTGPNGWSAVPNNQSGLVSVSGFDSGLGANAVSASSNGRIGRFTFTVANSATNFTAQLISNGTNLTDLSDSDGNTISVTLPLVLNVPIACFATGTLIRTDRGDISVEYLRAGDCCLTASGYRPIIWIGHRRLRCVNHPRPWDVMPVRIVANAFSDGCPSRDLLLSPDHAVFAQGALIPVRYLVNDATIIQEHADEITYWHVELDAHGIVLAEGLQVESYLDTGNRDSFENAPVTALQPNFGIRDEASWATQACAPLVEAGPILETARAQLRERAGPLIPAAEIIRIDAAGTVNAILPAGTRRVHLISRCVHPAGEHRRLGVALSAIRIGATVLALDAPSLASGFHEVEAGWRWTNGEAVLLLESCEVDTPIEICVAMMARSDVAAA